MTTTFLSRLAPLLLHSPTLKKPKTNAKRLTTNDNDNKFPPLLLPQLGGAEPGDAGHGAVLRVLRGAGTHRRYHVAGLYKLNIVQRAPGFDPGAYDVRNWFKSLLHIRLVPLPRGRRAWGCPCACRPRWGSAR
jgi:hypothetical protein